MDPKIWMKKTFQEYANKSVRLICFPLPPTPTSNNVIYMPDAFMSKTFDIDPSFDRSKQFDVVSAKPSRLGPAVLAFVKLRALVGFEGGGLLNIDSSTCCASVSYYVLGKDGGNTYADKVQLDGLTMTHRSCHPGSHYVVPGAPYLTAFLQYAQAPDVESGKDRRGNSLKITYMDPTEAMAIFPEVAFDRNIVIDNYISKCVIDTSISYLATKGGLGRWSIPYLARLRRNIVDIQEKDYEQWTRHEVPCDARQEDVGEGHSDSEGTAGSVPEEGDRDHGRSSTVACGAGQGASGSEGWQG